MHYLCTKREMSEVSVVIVSMNRPDLLVPCLESLYSNNKCGCEVFVVAYMYESDNLALIRTRFPDIQIIESNEVRGFSENNNLALRKVRTPFVFIVNDDTLQQMPVIDCLLQDIKALPDKVASVSPRIVFPDGRVQTCGRAPWTSWRWMKHYLHIEDETNPGKWTMGEGLFRSYTLNGACFLARTDAFREAGWFDERFFFTPEDIALGHKFNDMGYEVWADAAVSIVHIASSSTSSLSAAIKPARIRGSLLFFSRGSKLRYALLGIYACAIETARYLKYLLKGCRTEKDRIMKASARNVLRSVFSGKSAKELFIGFKDELPLK